MVVCARVPLTPIVLVERVHAGEVDGEGLEGRRQADAALRSLHVKARRRARVGRLGQARLGILHAEYGARRLGWLSAAPHGRSNSPRKEESSERRPHRTQSVRKLGRNKSQQKLACGDFDALVSNRVNGPAVQNHVGEERNVNMELRRCAVVRFLLWFLDSWFTRAEHPPLPPSGLIRSPRSAPCRQNSLNSALHVGRTSCCVVAHSLDARSPSCSCRGKTLVVKVLL